MSESNKISDAPRKAQDTTARSASMAGHAGGDRSTGDGEQPVKARSVGHPGGRRCGGAGETRRTHVPGGDRSRHQDGLGAGNVANRPECDSRGRRPDGRCRYDQGRRFLASTRMRWISIRRRDGAFAERVQALMSSALTLTRGLQKMQHAWLEILDNSMEQPCIAQDLLR